MSLRYRFEVFGKVQKVYFRKYTQEKGQSLGLAGWCQNSPQGTVIGEFQGVRENCDVMLQWLKTTGSPSSVIERVEFMEIPVVALSSPVEFVVDRSKARRF